MNEGRLVGAVVVQNQMDSEHGGHLLHRSCRGTSETQSLRCRRCTWPITGPSSHPGRQTATSCHAAYSHDSVARAAPGASAAAAACDPTLGSDDFSSTQRTNARSGGCRYSPTMSRTFSMNSGSFESLNVSLRCGCKAKARQMRLIVLRLKPGCLGHRAGAPVRGVRGPALQRPRQHRFDLRIGHGARGARPRLIQQAVKAVGHKPHPPPADGLLGNPQLLRHPRVRLPRGATQNQARALRQCLGRAGSSRPAFQRLPFVGGERQRWCRATRAHGRSPFTTENAGRAQVVSIISGSGH